MIENRLKKGLGRGLSSLLGDNSKKIETNKSKNSQLHNKIRRFNTIRENYTNRKYNTNREYNNNNNIIIFLIILLLIFIIIKKINL